MTEGTTALVVALGSCAAAAAGVRAFARWARARRLLDIPNERSSHEVPTPRGAGVVIVAVVSLALALVSAFVPHHGWTIAAAALVVAAVSAVDDVRPLPTAVRLLVHVACASVAVLSIGPATGLPGTSSALVLGVLWVVGLTNAYNFMDGIDGIAGAQAVVTGGTAAIAAGAAALPFESAAGAAFAGAAAGFLVYNWAPARVFMGDVGSAFLGFAFACLALRVGSASVPLATTIAASLWPFLFDTSLTLLRRVARRENILVSHRSHLYQRLVICGWPHRRVTLLYTGLAAAGACLAASWSLLGASWVVLLTVPAMALALWILVRRSEDLHRAAVGGSRTSATAGRRV